MFHHVYMFACSRWQKAPNESGRLCNLYGRSRRLLDSSLASTFAAPAAAALAAIFCSCFFAVTNCAKHQSTQGKHPVM